MLRVKLRFVLREVVPGLGGLAIKGNVSGPAVMLDAEHIPFADRGHHRTRDDRSDAGHAHQPLATGILVRECFKLARQSLDPLIEPAPVAG
jgi:hypothetical protein